MIEHPNALLLHHCLQAANAGDRQTLEALWAEDIVWEVKGASPWAGEFKGAEEVFDYLADLGEFGGVGFDLDIEDVLVSHRRAAVICRSKAAHGDRMLEARILLIATIVDRRIQHVTSVPIDNDRIEAFWDGLAA